MIDKASTIEYAENIYGLAANYLNKNQNDRLVFLMDKLEKLELEYIMNDSNDLLKRNNELIIKIVTEMEVIIND